MTSLKHGAARSVTVTKEGKYCFMLFLYIYSDIYKGNLYQCIDAWVIPWYLFIRDGLIVDLEATMGTYEVRSYGGGQKIMTGNEVNSF